MRAGDENISEHFGNGGVGMKKSLTQHIRKIAQEPVGIEFVPKNSTTQAEALARKMWQMAQGYDEKLDSGKKRIHIPDKTMIAEIINRLEGRVATADTKDLKRKATIVDKVKEQSRERMNALAKEVGSNGS